MQSDEDLMKAYIEGDATAFVELYRRYETRLYGFFGRRLSPEKKKGTSDLFQKTWLKVHHYRRSFDPTKKFSAWIFSVALNCLRDHLSLSSETQIFLSLDDQALEQNGTPGSQNSPEKDAITKDRLVHLHSALEKLPENQRQAILLCEWEGHTSKEISRTLGISEGGVRQLIFRARTKLRNLLSQDYKEHEEEE